MRYLIMIAALTLVLVSGMEAQLKSQLSGQPSASESLIRPNSTIGSFLGLLNLENLNMRHNLSFSYMTSGGAGLSLASYTNTMLYKFSDPLNVRFDVTLQGSPFGQYGAAQQGDLSRLYLSRAELNYRPWENFAVKLQYREVPYGYYDNYYPWYPTSSAWGDE